MAHGQRMIGFAIRCDLLETGQNFRQAAGMAARGSRHFHRIGIDKDADLVALRACKIGHAGGNNRCIAEFAAWRFFALIVHRGAGIQQDGAAQISLFMIYFRAGLTLPRKQLPVEMLQVVAGNIAAVLHEFTAGTAASAAVQAGYQPLDSGLCQQMVIADTRQNGRG